MKAMSLSLVGLVYLMGAPLEPASAIDFGPALYLKKNHRCTAIWTLSAGPEGPMVAGGQHR